MLYNRSKYSITLVSKHFLMSIVIVMFFFFGFSNLYSTSDNDVVCCYWDKEVSQEIRGTCDEQGHTSIGLYDTNNDVEGSISGVDVNCEQLVLNYGVECKLDGGYDSSQFYMSYFGEYYPNLFTCEYEEISDNDFSWFNEEGTSESTIEDDEDLESTTGAVIVTDDVYQDYDYNEIGLNEPFDISTADICEYSNHFLSDSFLTPNECDVRDGIYGSGDCVYDPKRAGKITQREGDSSNDGIYNVLQSDVMCVSKSNTIFECSDINSKEVCQNYGELQARENSLIGYYGCYWRENELSGGSCITKEIYYRSQEDYDNKEFSEIDIRSAIERRNFIENPSFEYEFSSSDWIVDENRGDVRRVQNTEYNNFLGSYYIELEGKLSQLISAIPSSLTFEIIVFSNQESSSVFSLTIDEESIDTFEHRELYSFEDTNSNSITSQIYVSLYEFENSVEYASRILSLQSDESVDILGVFVRVKESDSTATFKERISNVYPEELFVAGSFDCSICSETGELGLCSIENLDEFSSCERIAPENDVYSLEEVYDLEEHRYYDDKSMEYVNPYARVLGAEHIFLEEDSVFCELYIDEDSCTNPDNKLNSKWSQYHQTSNGLCKWQSSSQLPNDGICFKDSNDDNLPDTIISGEITELDELILNEDYVFSNYNVEYNEKFNDFQLSCDVLPPKVFIQAYKTSLNEDGELVTLPLQENEYDNGVLSYVYVRIEEYLSSSCDIYNENGKNRYPRSVTLAFDNDIEILASSFFPEYENGTEYFEKMYSSSEFLQLLDYIELDESYLESGNIRVFDAAGNKGSTVTFATGSFSDPIEFDVEISLKSQLGEIFNGSTLSILSDESDEEERIQKCSITAVENQEVIYFKEDIEEFGSDVNYPIGNDIYVAIEEKYGLSSSRSFEVFIQVACNDEFNRLKVILEDVVFSTQDSIIVQTLGNGIVNSQDISYINSDAKDVQLELIAKEDVICSDVIVRGYEDSSFGAISFDKNDDSLYSKYSNSLFDFSQLLLDDGIYDVVLECSNTQGDFEKVIPFELDTEPFNEDKIKFIHKEDSKWTEIDSKVYIDASEGLLVNSNNIIDTNSFNDFFSSNIIFEAKNEVLIDSITMCDSIPLEIDKYVSSDIITFDDSNSCAVEFDSEENLLAFTSPITIEDVLGGVFNYEIVTYFEVIEPEISLSTLNGGITYDDVVYFSSDSPEFILSLQIGSHRAFTCSLSLEAGGSRYDIIRNSVDGEISFTIDDFTSQDVLSIPNANSYITADCEDLMFNYKDSKTIRIEKDTVVPVIEGIEVEGLGKNWVFPEDGIVGSRSDVIITLQEREEFVICTYYVSSVSVDEIIQSLSFKEVSDSKSSRLIATNELMISRGEEFTDSFMEVSSGDVLGTDFAITLECTDAAGNSVVEEFDEFRIDLFSSGEIQAYSGAGEDNILDITVNSLFNISGSTVLLRDELRNEVLYSGTLEALEYSLVERESFHQLEIKNIVELDLLSDREEYPMSINFSFSNGYYLKDEFNVLIDNQEPEIVTTLNTNSQGVIYGTIVTGIVEVSDSPDYSLGLSSIDIELGVKNGNVLHSLSYDLGLDKYESIPISFDDIEPNVYELTVLAKDKRGNSKLEVFEFETTDSFAVVVLNSSNTATYSMFPTVWYSSVEKPILKFKTTKSAKSCVLTPGIEEGYIGSEYAFDEIAPNEFDLNLNIKEDFKIKSGKQKVEIVCVKDGNESDENERSEENDENSEDVEDEARVVVFLDYSNYVPDYTLEIEWGRVQYVNELEVKEVNFLLQQNGYFKEVLCAVFLRGDNDREVLLTPLLEEFGSFSGGSELGVGNYAFEVSCETPLGVKGATKVYEFEVIKEEFDIDLISLSVIRDGLVRDDLQADVSSSPIILADPQAYGEEILEYEVQFITNFQEELGCDIDIKKEEGVFNFITQWFNTQSSQEVVPKELGVYSSIISVSNETKGMVIECSKDSFKSEEFEFEFDFLDVEEYSINGIEVVEES